MKVSVIIRTYNRGYIIGEAIESALQQTHDDFEIIVVDDGSSDDTADVVASFQSDRLRYIRHAQNRGVSAAGNTGIQAATGELIAHLDSDDLWAPDLLSSLVAILSQHDDVAAAFSDVEVHRGTRISSIVGSMRAFPKLIAARADGSGVFIFSSRDMYLCLLEEVPIKPTALLVRRRVLDEIGGYDEAWCSGEDWELYLRIAKRYGFGYVDRKLAIMRVLADSTLAKYQEQDKSSLLRLALSEKKALAHDGEALQVVNRSIYHHSKDLGWIYLHTDRRFKSLRTYLLGFFETRQLRLVLRAGVALMPLQLVSGLKSIFLPGRRAES
jgi:glycosyltransferase involved in cell wall biosynthesis